MSNTEQLTDEQKAAYNDALQLIMDKFGCTASEAMDKLTLVFEGIASF